MKLHILLVAHYRLLSIAAAIDVFETVNSFLVQSGEHPLFQIVFVGAKQQLPDAFAHYPFCSLESVKEQADWVIVPAFANYQMQQNIEQNVDFIPFMLQQYQQGAALISFCTGSFLLAASGLLRGLPATTHIEATTAFAHVFPDVDLQPHAVVTHSNNIFTSGGATSSFHLKLMLIQKYCGRAMAVRVAKNFAIDMDRNNQLYFDSFEPRICTEDELVQQVQLIIQQRFPELKNVEEALDTVPSSRRNIIRRFKHATGMTPIKYLQKTKITAAKSLLETTHKDITTIMLASGYSDAKSFRQLFKSFTGLSPKDYRGKFGL